MREYEVEKQSQDELAERDLEANLVGSIKMFSPDFNVESVVPEVYKSKIGNLTDNSEANVIVKLKGTVRSLVGHSVSMTVVRANKRETVKNNVNIFSINVSADPKTLKWPTSKTYWYGVPMPSPDTDWDTWNMCCCTYPSPYEFILRVDGVDCMKRIYTVGKPNEDPKMLVVSPKTDSRGKWPCAASITQVEVESSGQIKVSISISAYQKKGRIIGIPAYCQYADKIKLEEEFHKKQLEAKCSIEQGGSVDLFTIKGYEYFLKKCLTSRGLSLMKDSGGGLFVMLPSGTDLSALNSSLAEAAELEGNKSCALWNSRRIYRELKAKEAVNYGVYGAYHCTYYQDNKSEGRSPTLGVKHPAYED